MAADANVAAIVQINPGHIEADPVGIRNASRGDQDVAAFDSPLAGGRARRNSDLFAGSSAHVTDLGRDGKLNAFRAENALQFVGNVG